MKLSRFLHLIVLMLVCAGGCTSAAKKDELSLPDFDQSEWLDAVRMSNGTVNLVVVPSIGRIMRYGFVGEPSVLWTNPHLTGKSVASTQPAWKNFGGEKVWIWPQDQWPQRIGRAWPPPAEVDQRPMTWRMIDSLHIIMTSEPVKGYGVRVVRDIALAPSGTRVTLTTRFEPVEKEKPADDLAAWSIAQIPAGKAYARLLGARTHRGLPPAPWDGVRSISPRVVALDAPTDADGKIGLDADTLAWVSGNLLLVQHSQTAAQLGEQFKSAERAQVYFAHPQRLATAKLSPYLEFELTSPRVDGSQGAMPELRVIWELYSAPKVWTDEAVAQFLAP